MKIEYWDPDKNAWIEGTEWIMGVIRDKFIDPELVLEALEKGEEIPLQFTVIRKKSE